MLALQPFNLYDCWGGVDGEVPTCHADFEKWQCHPVKLKIPHVDQVNFKVTTGNKA